MSTKNCYRPNEFAALIGVSVKTLQRWDSEGKLKANRNPSNRRYYTHEQYLEYQGIKPETDRNVTVIYARVSTRSQKDDLKNQIEFLKQFCNARGFIVDACIEDFGSGLNYNRKNWNALLDRVMLGEISQIVISNKDRFVRFGFDWFENFCLKFGTKILVVNNEAMSTNQELVEDLIFILHVFSCRLYGLRKYKSKIKEDADLVSCIQDGNQSDTGTSL